MAKTVQDVFDEMTDVQKDAAALLFGALAENDESVGGDTLVNESQTLLDVYSSMSLTEKALVDFVAGGIEASARHDDISSDDEFMEDFLEHYGVKGMRWGVRRQDRTTGPGKVALSKSARNNSAARREARVKVGQRVASLDEAHVAGLKSTGHRVANAFLGDKTFWKRAVGIAVATGAGWAISAYGPGMLPDDVINAVAKRDFGNDAVAERIVKNDPEYARVMGEHQLATIGLLATAGTAAVATSANSITNLGRAVRGNARISKSHAQLGEALVKHQGKGSDKTKRVLQRNGSIKLKSDKRLAVVRQDDISEGTFMDGFLRDVTAFTHAVVEGLDAKRDGTPKGGKNKGGDGDFDENKVKRDGRGRFSKQDERWASKKVQEDLRWKLLGAAWEAVVPEMERIGAEYGAKTMEEFADKVPESEQKRVSDLIYEAAERLAPKITASPSGEFYINPLPKKQGGKDYKISRVRHDDLALDCDEEIDQNVDERSLKHFGIKGMRWGIRRKVTSNGTVDKSDAGQPSGKSMSDETAELQKSADFDRAAKAYAKADEKGLQALSNEEIKAITNRIQSEKAFRSLSEPQQNELQSRVNQLRLEKEYRQLQGELAQKKQSTGKKVVAGLLGAALSAAQKEASDLGKSLVQDMVGKKKTPTLKDQLKSKNELLRLRKENAELYRDLGSLGAMPSASGTPFRVNPAKVKISRP